MGGDLTGVDLKLSRANAQIADLRQRVEVALDPRNYSFALEHDSATRMHVYRVHGLPAVPPEWALEIGEIVYQLRSALDHLAWQLVLLDGGTPGHLTDFPIRDTPLARRDVAQRVNTRPKIKDSEILLALDGCSRIVGSLPAPGLSDRRPVGLDTLLTVCWTPLAFVDYLAPCDEPIPSKASSAGDGLPGSIPSPV